GGGLGGGGGAALAGSMGRRGGPAQRADAVMEALPARSWRTVAWREGSRGWLRGPFVAVRAWRGSTPGRRRAGWLIGERTAEGKLKYYWSNLREKVALERLAEYAHRRHWGGRCHKEAKGHFGWESDQGRVGRGVDRHAVSVMLAYSFLVWREWQGRVDRRRPGRRRRDRSPRPDRRRASLPEVHRQVCDWLRLQAAKEWLGREFMTVPE